MLNNDLLRHGPEFARAIDQHQYEVTPQGIYFPKQRAMVMGQFDTWINGADHQVDPNIVPTEALDYLLKAGLKNVGGLATWYVAPFLNNVVPASTLTAANFNTVMGEFIAYNELTRVAYTTPADPTAGAFSNSAAPSVFTAAASVGADPGVNIYGAAILSASGKAAITGKILCCSKFSGLRNVKATDLLTVQYTLSATSTT